MRLFKLFVCATVLLAMSACGPSRHTSSDVNLSAIREYAFIQPYSYIVCYGDDGKGYLDKDDCRKATELITSIINSERFPFSDDIEVDYDDDDAPIRKWIENFPDVDPTKIDRLRVPKSLCKLIESKGLRYGIVIYSYGYTQTVKGYQREKVTKAAQQAIDSVVKSITGISGLTNPSQSYYVNSPYGNVLYCAVVDAEADRVVHFVEEVPTLASHPTTRADVSELLHKLLKEFIR